MNQNYVYIVFRPNGIPCYVGKGKGERWKRHLNKSHNPYLQRIAKKAGGNLPIVIIRSNLTHAEAFEIEIAFIKAIGRIKNGGPLVNMTDGGDGVVGLTQTPEHLAKLSAVRKGKSPSLQARELIRVKLKNRPKSPEHCAAVSAAKKGVSQGPLSLSHRHAIGAAHLGQKRSPEAKLAMRIAWQRRRERVHAYIAEYAKWGDGASAGLL